MGQKNRPATGAGDVQIELDGQTVMLRPSLEACQVVTGFPGGLQGAIRACQEFSLDGMTTIIMAGLQKRDLSRKRAEAMVYEAGLFEIAPALIRFCTIVGNGGRPPARDTDDDEATEGTDGPLAPGA